MQANGSLRRPLWDIIKAIGGAATTGGHVQCRRFHIQRVSVDVDPEEAATSSQREAARATQREELDAAHREFSGVGDDGRCERPREVTREQSRRLPSQRVPSKTAQRGQLEQREVGSGKDVQKVATVDGAEVEGATGRRGRLQRQAQARGRDQRLRIQRVPLSKLSPTGDHGSKAMFVAQESHLNHLHQHDARRGPGLLFGEARKKGEHAEEFVQEEGHAHTSAVRTVFISQNESEKAKEERDDVNAAGAFEAVVQRAIANPVDNKLQRWPTLAPDGELRPRYFKAYQGAFQHRLRKQVLRWQRNRERYGLENARNWRSALDLLDRATPTGETRHKRRMETVRLDDGLQATWKLHPGEVVLEIMQRTGAHLQTLSLTGAVGTFNSVSLWGTPAQNEHAKRLLPTYVEAADSEQQPVKVYSLKSEISRDVDAALAIFGTDAKDETDADYWREQEGMDDVEMELLEDALGDITDAPPRDPAPIRAVWAPSIISIRSRPTQWNQLTFSAYVDALTRPISRLAQRKLYGVQSPRSTQAHAETMTAELVRVFTGNKSSAFASASALDTAVRYFLKYNDLPAARKVLLGLENQQFDFTASNFNLFLEVAAREESIPNFIYTLRHMISKGLRPTAGSWTIFHLLMSRRFPLETNVVTEAMRRKGFFSNADTVKKVAAGNADRAIAAHLSVGKSVQDFMLSCEASYGEPALWLSAGFANRIARVLLERGRIEDATNIVRQLEATARDRGRQGVTTATLNTFLSSCVRSRTTEGALAYVRLFMPPPPSTEDPSRPRAPPIGRFTDDPLAIQPDHITYGILFGMAWHHRFHNVLRVIWRHACASGEVSFKMQHVVQRSLGQPIGTLEHLSNEEGDIRVNKDKKWPISDRLLWNTLAGKFVVGLDAGLSGASASSEGSSGILWPDETAEASGAAERNPLAPFIASFESSNEPKPPKRTKEPTPKPLKLAALRDLYSRKRVARTLIRADLDEVGSISPTNHFLRDLERAWRLDVIWKEENLGKRQQVKSRKQGNKEDVAGGVARKGKRKERTVTQRDSILDMFREMLDRGVRVPMVVGDGAGVRDAEGLADVRNELFEGRRVRA